jgi:hypothetical protein
MFQRFFAVLLLVASVALFFMYVNPTYSTVKELQIKEEELNDALGKAKELQAVRDSLLSKYNTFSKEDQLRLEKLLPDHIDNVRLVIDIEEIAKRHNLTVSGLNIASTDTPTSDGSINERGVSSGRGALGSAHGGLVGEVTFSFSVSTSYEVFLQFLRDLENSLRLIDVTALSFVSANENFYEFDISIKTYWLR